MLMAAGPSFGWLGRVPAAASGLSLQLPTHTEIENVLEI